MRQHNTLERRELVDEILREGALYNSAKIHLISHYAEQIPKFRSLPQYSTDIRKYMRKGLQDAYRWSNKVESLSQIVTPYTRDHTFAMKDLTISTWKPIRRKPNLTARVGEDPTVSQIYLKLQRKANVVLNLTVLENESSVHNLRGATRSFFTRELRETNTNVERLLDHEMRAYGAPQVPVPKLNDQGFVVHHARCFRESTFSGTKRNDWVRVRRHLESDTAHPDTLNEHVLGRLHALFKLTSKGIVYRLAYVNLLNFVVGTCLQDVEGMLCFGLPTCEAGIVIPIAKIEGIAYLIPLELWQSWLVNNCINIET